MRLLAAMLLLPGLAAPARAGSYFIDRAILGVAGDYYGHRLEVGAPVGQAGKYRLSAGENSFQYAGQFRGNAPEYWAGLKRELYHVTIAGRFATRPPNAQRESYHVARGEMWFNFYGLTLGPGRPEISNVVWESTEPVPDAGSLDRTWVTTLHGRYTNTDHHLYSDVLKNDVSNLTALVQNSWQAELQEVWRDRASITVQTGFHRYNKVIDGTFKTVFLDNIRYPGGVFAVQGWPNNQAGVEGWRRFGVWNLSGGFTRLSLLGGQAEYLFGGELAWKPRPEFSLGLGYYRRRRRGSYDTKGVSAQLALGL